MATQEKKVKKSVRKSVRQYLADIGSRGGQTTGDTKVRGNSDYYRQMRLRAIRKKKREQKAAEQKPRKVRIAKRVDDDESDS